ncbi:hypothetical protein OROGR_031285 [Orobanche gracilis]
MWSFTSIIMFFLGFQTGKMSVKQSCTAREFDNGETP